MGHLALILAAALARAPAAGRERLAGDPADGSASAIAIKSGVNLRGLDPRLGAVLRTARELWRERGRDSGCCWKTTTSMWNVAAGPSPPVCG